ARSTRWRRSVATSSPATAASTASSAWRNSSRSSRSSADPVALPGDESAIDGLSVPGHDDRRVQLEQLVERARPLLRERIRTDRRIGALLDQVSGEEHLRIGYVHRQIVVGVATTGVDEAHRSAAQVELDRVPHAMGGGNQGWFGRTRVVLGPLDEDVLVDLAAFVCPDVGAWESDRAQAVVEVCVGD